MKNSKYFPFERNKYFYGKLLSVDDFELEQNYVNNKRRMTNRFLQGAGVAAGLYVVRMDEKTVSVENGFALDAFGREIVVDLPVICRLSLLEGYQECVEGGSGDYVYLCLDYKEEETGAVHNIAANTAIPDEAQAFGKIKESYRLYLTDTEPKSEAFHPCALYEQSHMLYAQNGICIRQVVPKYIRAGCDGEIRFEIENVTKRYLAFSAEVVLECLEQEGRTVFTASFNEAQYEKTGKYLLSCRISAADLPGAAAAVCLKKNSIQLYLDKEPAAYYGEDMVFPVQIVRGDIRNQVIQDYCRTAMGHIVDLDKQERLYLAKIYLLRTYDTGDGACVIDRVENLPFGQFIMNQNLSFALHRLAIDGQDADGLSKPDVLQNRMGGFKNQEIKNADQGQGARFSQGTYWLDLNGGGQRGDRFVSEEIAHGLGLGPTAMLVGLEDGDGVTTYGSSEIFPDMELMLELAVRTYPDKGTFQIAGRLREQAIQSGVLVHWAAIRNVEEKSPKKVVRKIFIKPGILELSVRESHYLEAVCTNMEDQAVEWSIQAHGGSITPNGLYTAPNVPGVYEIVAQSVAYPQVRASIFAVVREA